MTKKGNGREAFREEIPGLLEYRRDGKEAGE
jgi:hypothetical protein